jgi:CRP/FNR family transcriptional regulator, cyclic AMP receptor protein
MKKMSGQISKIVKTKVMLPGVMKNEINSFFQFFNFPKLTLFADQKLFNQNSKPVNIYYVQDGQIRLTQKDSQNNERIVRYANPGSFLGIDNVIYSEKYTYSAFAEKDSELIAISKENFQQILHTNPDASKQFIVFLCKLLYAADKNIYDKNQMYMKRVAEAIIILFSNPELKKRGDNLKVTYSDIHHLTGIPVPVVENTLNEFSTKQLIHTFRKRIKDVDIKGLKKLIYNN